MLFCFSQLGMAQQITHYYGFDKQISIVKSSEELIVQFNSTINDTEVQSIIANLENTQHKRNIGGNRHILSCLNPASTKASLDLMQTVNYSYAAYELDDARLIPFIMYLSNKIVLKFKASVSQTMQQQIELANNLSFSKSNDVYTMYEVAKGQDPLLVANQLQESGNVVFSHPDFISELEYYDYTPTDPLYSEQWNLNNTGQLTTNTLGEYATPGADIKMPAAWDITRGSEDIIVAVVDDGLTSNHPDLPNSRQIRLNGSNIGAIHDDGSVLNDPSPFLGELNSGKTDIGHGNACAGLIGASHNNEGIAGIAPNCKIMPIRLGHGYLPLSAYTDAIIFAYTNGADVISLSVGPYAYVASTVIAIENAVTIGRDSKGCVFSIAAGNNGSRTTLYSTNGGPSIPPKDGDVAFPANVEISGVLTVGASNRNDVQTNYSPNGDLLESDQRLDIVAPSHNFYAYHVLPVGYDYGFGKYGEGGEIYTMDIPGNPGFNPNKELFYAPSIGEELPASGTNHLAYTARFGGTSAATPQVAGVAALLLSVAPCLTQLEVFDLITNAADNVGGYDYTWDGLGRSKEFGFGRLDAKQALTDLFSATELYDDYTVPSGTTTWTTPATVIGQVHIPDGATLNINNTSVEFIQGAGIVVERGGRLIVRNSTLTSTEDACGEEKFWDGIQIWGTTTAQQFFGSSNNGVVRIIEGSIIENAKNAVQVYRVNDEGEINWNYNGGVIVTDDATFRNNWRDVAFLSYHNGSLTSELGNLSSFKNTEFITIGGLLNDVKPAVHVTMYNVEGITFNGCTFGNLSPFLYPNVEDRGNGIRSIGAGYKIGSTCASFGTGTCPESDIQPSQFLNLEMGIEADAVGSLNTIIVNGAEFDNVQQGIIMNSVDYATLVHNNFTIPSTPIGGFGALGIYMNQCTAYEVEENTFVGPGVSGEEVSYGVVGIHSGDLPNQVYKNDFFNLRVGSLIMGDNRDEDNGLVMKCNNYSDCIYDIALTFGGEIARQQGSSFSQSSPAGNTFTHNCTDLNDNDYYAQLSSGDINYWTHNDISPSCFTTPLIGLSLTGYNYIGNETASCPSNVSLDQLPIGGSLDNFQQFLEYGLMAQTEIDNLANAIDGGNKQLLLNNIYNNMASSQLVTSLLNASPLSDEVLIAAINDKPTPLSGNELVQIVVENSPVTAQVMQAIIARNPALPASKMHQINNAQIGNSDRELVESDLAYWKSKRELAYNDAIRTALSRHEIGLGTVQLKQVFDLRDGAQDQYLKAQAEIRNGNYTSASAILNAQQGTTSQSDLFDYTSLLLSWAQNPEHIYSCNSQQQQDLFGIVNNNGVISVKAQVILREVFGENLILPLELPSISSQYRKRIVETRIQGFDDLSIIFIYPNPADQSFNIEMALGEGKTATIIMYDMTGKQVMNATTTQSSYLVSTQSFVDGIYLVGILLEDRLVEFKKVLIKH